MLPSTSTLHYAGLVFVSMIYFARRDSLYTTTRFFRLRNNISLGMQCVLNILLHSSQSSYLFSYKLFCSEYIYLNRFFFVFFTISVCSSYLFRIYVLLF